MDEVGEPPDITRLLRQWRNGDAEALDRLVPMVYGELHTLASRYLSRERSDHTLQTTALVNEAYLRLAGQRAVEWQNRAHFFGIAAQLMRRILVDHARRDRRKKRGGGSLHIAVEDVDPPSPSPAVDAADAYTLDRVLSRLEAIDPQQGRVVELRYFGGMTVEESAEVLGVSPATVKRDWSVARAWLYRELADPASSPAPGED